MNSRNQHSLFLFDIDCTLLLTGGAGREATRRSMIDVFGSTASLDTHHFGGKTDWYTLIELLSEHGHDERSIGEVMAVYRERMRQHLSDVIDDFPVYALPGAHELVTELRGRGAMLGVVTGNVSTTAPIKLRAAGFDPAWFPVGAYGDEAVSRDDLPMLALERARNYWQRDIDAAEILILGDTPADVACARAVGATVVAVETGFCRPGELEASQPDYLIPDLTHFWQLDILNK